MPADACGPGRRDRHTDHHRHPRGDLLSTAIELRTLSAREITEHGDAFVEIASDVPNEYWTLDHFLRDLPEKWTLSFAAWCDDAPIGYAILSRKTPDRVHLHHFMITAAQRGSGLGARMVGEMTARAASTGADRLSLKVGNADARRFYERNGFVRTGEDNTYDVLERSLAGSSARIVAIHQPNYAPWLGYFRKIACADLLVFLDDAQFSKGSYTNRVQIARDGGARWLTQPVQHRLGQPIREVGFADPAWPAKHLDALRGAYRSAPRFRATWDSVVAIYERIPLDDLATANQTLIQALTERLGLQCDFGLASRHPSESERADDRLISLIRQLAPGGTYLSGKGGASYQDPEKFKAAGVPLRYLAFDHPTYSQGDGAFLPGLSVLDAVFHLGWDGTRALIVD